MRFRVSGFRVSGFRVSGLRVETLRFAGDATGLMR